MELAGGAVERRERQLLSELVQARRRAPRPWLTRILDWLWLIGSPAERQRRHSQRQRGDHGSHHQDPGPHRLTPPLRPSAIGRSAARPKPAAIRNELLNAW